MKDADMLERARESIDSGAARAKLEETQARREAHLGSTR